VQRSVLVNAKAALETLGCSGAELEVIAAAIQLSAMHCSAVKCSAVQCSAVQCSARCRLMILRPPPKTQSEQCS
jgi:hypothetical protein